MKVINLNTKWTKNDIPDYPKLEEFRKKMEAALKKDGIPICVYCEKKMKNRVPKHGKFKGQLQRHSFVCDCEKGKNVVSSVG